uniref:E0916d7c-ff40-4279-b862-fea15b54f154-CDS n=1 Tax=Plasmodiophora brassicae TaxID=37360 RepID=A0A3P3YWG0_PLABS|nr:e0916d7c-ff40-4279-b862-fea15b54f154-CDS [Plasmodiophora brassicae]
MFIYIFQHNKLLYIRGPLGLLRYNVPSGIDICKYRSMVYISGQKAAHPLVAMSHRIVCQKMKGLEVGFSEIMIIAGMGWRVDKEDVLLKFTIGYSHIVHYLIPNDIEIVLLSKNLFKIFGSDLSRIQCIASELCKLRSSDVYKGKGIRRQAFKVVLKSSTKSKV